MIAKRFDILGSAPSLLIAATTTIWRFLCCRRRGDRIVSNDVRSYPRSETCYEPENGEVVYHWRRMVTTARLR